MTLKRIRKVVPSKASGGALSKALKAEKSKYDSDQTEKFRASRDKEKALESRQKFPRSFSNGTFFTPHIATKHTISEARDIKHEYAAVIKINGKWIITSPTFNPTAVPSNPSQPLNLSGLPQEINDKVHELERKGFNFVGTNQDILVFERIYSQRQRGRAWASNSAIALTTSVLLLTGTLFALEYLI